MWINFQIPEKKNDEEAAVLSVQRRRAANNSRREHSRWRGSRAPEKWVSSTLLRPRLAFTKPIFTFALARDPQALSPDATMHHGDHCVSGNSQSSPSTLSSSLLAILSQFLFLIFLNFRWGVWASEGVKVQDRPRGKRLFWRRCLKHRLPNLEAAGTLSSLSPRSRRCCLAGIAGSPSLRFLERREYFLSDATRVRPELGDLPAILGALTIFSSILWMILRRLKQER